MITTNNRKIYDNLLLDRNPGMHKNIKSFKNKHLAFTNKNHVNPWYYEMDDFSYNFRITDIQSSLGNNQLKKIDFFADKRRKIAKIYDNEFSKNEYILTPKVNSNVLHGYHLYTIL